MRRAALRSALSVKASASQIIVVDELSMEAPKTKVMAQTLKALEAADGKALILLPERNTMVELSVRNLSTAKTLRASYLNIRDLLGADYIVMPLGALEVIENILGGADKKSEE